MAQRSKVNYKSTKNSRFPDNTTGLITAGHSRDMHEDTADSAMFIEDNAYSSFIATASGTDTYTATLSPVISAYSSDQKYFIKFTNANTGAATLNLNSLGAISIVKNGSTALAAGDISAGQIYVIAYDGTNMQILGRISSGIGGSTGSVDNAILRADGTGGSTIQAGSLIYATDDGRLYGTALHNNAGAVTGTTNQYIASGTYTPTLTDTSNVDASSATVSQWIRVGNVVNVSGIVNIDPTSSATTTNIGISLPIASNFANASQCAGILSDGFSDQSGRINADTTNDRATVEFQSKTTASRAFSFTFMYLIV